MTEDFKPRPDAVDKRAWLASADTACKKARADAAAAGSRPKQTSEQLLAIVTDLVKLEGNLLATINALPALRSDRGLLPSSVPPSRRLFLPIKQRSPR